MSSHTQLIENFYNSFARRDYAGMVACYDTAIDFADPVFALQGKRVGAM